MKTIYGIAASITYLFLMNGYGKKVIPVYGYAAEYIKFIVSSLLICYTCLSVNTTLTYNIRTYTDLYNMYRISMDAWLKGTVSDLTQYWVLVKFRRPWQGNLTQDILNPLSYIYPITLIGIEPML